jgi:hypothetical protein
MGKRHHPYRGGIRMITPAILDEYDHRRAHGYSIPLWMMDAMATMLRSHPAITPELQSQKGEAITGCSFPQCHCQDKACASYVRARS